MNNYFLDLNERSKRLAEQVGFYLSEHAKMCKPACPFPM
jgi:hypothetical protein